MSVTDILVIAAALGFGAYVHTTAGFGSALIAMPLLSLRLGIATAAPLQAICSTIIGFYVLGRNWRGLQWRDALWILPATACGVPLGMLFLSRTDPAIVLRMLGLLLIAYAVYALAFAPRLAALPEDHQPSLRGRILGLFAGLAAGILGGAYNVNGPPLVIYGALQHWPKARFRSLLQTVFLFNGWMILAAHVAAGHVNETVAWSCLAALPGLVAGIALGHWTDLRLPPARFERVLLILILCLGITLLQ